MPVAEIEEIRQTHQKQSNHNRVMMTMQSGLRLQISANHSFDHVALYDALAKLNPEIKLPKSPWRFTQV